MPDQPGVQEVGEASTPSGPDAQGPDAVTATQKPLNQPDFDKLPVINATPPGWWEEFCKETALAMQVLGHSIQEGELQRVFFEEAGKWLRDYAKPAEDKPYALQQKPTPTNESLDAGNKTPSPTPPVADRGPAVRQM